MKFNPCCRANLALSNIKFIKQYHVYSKTQNKKEFKWEKLPLGKRGVRNGIDVVG